ncbi:M23 family metallopeptidase [Tepidicella xavieri]|uniref:Peptidase M23-like protein n=1 Tax=Tepidicella xavieri TaxID=360241 RepID=A0A4R6U9U3_9BURK|nr:peptidoglycan DD-metalloendopeptidase family protein [Tepidicella xavieri]TDQ43251.1 peptidase M23-like protein [Tepidicella xavieri]
MNELARQIRSTLNKHPKRVMAGLGAVLLGTGVTAFGIAPLDADIDQMPVRQLIEPVQLTAWSAQSSLEAPVPFILFRSDVTRRDDTVQSLLQRLGVNDAQAQQFLRRDTTAAELLRGRAGKLVRAETNDDQQLVRLTARWIANDNADHYQRLVIERQGEGFEARLEKGEFTSSVRLSSGTIRTSLFAATDAARLPDSIASQLADLFSAEIDFRRDLRAGDTFSVVYEALEADGELLRYGRLLSAEFVNKGKAHQVLWFEEPGKKGAYYTFEGESTRRAFLASPLAFSRISSGYGMRFHPVHGGQRPHLGVDYAAPTGTPVRTVGDGVVQFAGWQRGYGNVVYIQHRQDKVTVYAHLHRIDVRKGQRVEQGQLIGQVGCTGVCTGPHLHFEYRVRGEHRDPLIIAREGGGGEPVSAKARPAFDAAAQAMRLKLASASTIVQASAD